MNRVLFGIAALAAVGLMASPVPASAGGTDVLKAVDTDHDGTIDLKEVKAAAARKFDALDTDHDGTLDAKEIEGLGIVLKKADHDNDGTLDKKEFAKLAVKRFKAVEKDTDKVVDEAELASTEGAALAALIQ